MSSDLCLDSRHHLVDSLVRSQSNMACRGEGCRKYGIFCNPDRKGYWCKDHATEDMVRRNKNAMCKHEGCTKRATFGTPGTRSPLSCLAHRQPWEVDVANRMCVVPGCASQPTYGPYGERLRCGAHALKSDERWESRRARESRRVRESSEPRRPRRPRGRPKTSAPRQQSGRPRGRPRKDSSPNTQGHSESDEVWRLVEEALGDTQSSSWGSYSPDHELSLSESMETCDQLWSSYDTIAYDC